MSSTKVYIVEADKVLQHDLAAALEANGYDIVTFDGGYPIAALMDNWPDVFLIDIELPDINGMELCTWLKSHEDSRSIPVILISREEYLTVLAASSAADDLLEKPFGISDLVSRINGCLQSIV